MSQGERERQPPLGDYATTPSSMESQAWVGTGSEGVLPPLSRAGVPAAPASSFCKAKSGAVRRCVGLPHTV